jgi:pimeloyl-ACP methyl ester carboxylesterase
MRLPPIVLVHGAFCGGWVFDRFAGPFKKAGATVLAPDLPGHGPGEPAEAAAGLSMRDYAAALADLARQLEAPPVLVGHSMGALAALMAAARAPTAGVVLLAPSPPWGVSGSTMEEAISAVSLYAFGPYWAMAIRPDYPTLRRYGVDRLPAPERRAVFARMRAESGRALFEILNWWMDPFMTTLVRLAEVRAPILAVAGSLDAVHPPATVLETARHLGASVHVMDGMSHWLIAEPGWGDVADLTLAWIGEGASKSAA